ncbi:MAG: hypothetical protein C4532_07640 [Candidatus Abyssobacteria bacterium SURF_17]|uniref:Type I restriction modification DNA specificity domain-containing protein n=1 Tax=Candidatus Abyssobacteria bacterium SURF_17 TaxID=2093361 RepID=A0A419F0H6_9BACT|nr:MAG: hypothetical protein C4532_07640 [Candidatus Abyssubacteria bacterium SURF_17]
MSLKRSLIPDRWCLASLSEVAEINPAQLDIIPDDQGLVSFVPMAAAEALTGRLDPSEARPWGTVKKGYTRFQEGDILFAKITPSMENGKIVLAQGLMNQAGAGSTEFHVIRPSSLMDSRYLLHYLLREPLRREARGKMKGTAGQLRVPPNFLEELDMPIAPANEQHRIASEIDKHLSRLEASVKALKRVQANLKRYRTSVLKAAVEGRLVPTEAELARKEARDYEPADKLLERILKERRKKWEEQELAKMKAKGKTPRDDKWKAKYKAPSSPDISNLPVLSRGWVWTCFEQLAEQTPYAIKAGPFGSALKKDFYVPKGYKIYGQEQVIRNDPFFGDYYIDEKHYQSLKSCAVKPGDLLISLVGTIGKVLVLPNGIEEGIINPRLAKVSLNRKIVDPNYIRTYIVSSLAKDYFSLTSHGGTMDILNLGILRELPIPLPPLEEQKRIVRESERVLSLASKVEKTADETIKRASRLRENILKISFEGKLVSQAPNDEPASVLLQRIKTEKAENQRQTKARKRFNSGKVRKQMGLI